VAEKSITVEQFRAARALLDWSRSELARRAGQSPSTVKRVEGVASEPVSPEARQKLQATLEAAGVEFTNGDAPGVRLHPRKRPKGKKSG
jgi:transcriptional regulator with XRE-family HTH domain